MKSVTEYNRINNEVAKEHRKKMDLWAKELLAKLAKNREDGLGEEADIAAVKKAGSSILTDLYRNIHNL